jgi:hypothetical protein
VGKQYYIYLLLGAVILLILGLTFLYFYRVLLKDIIEVTGLVFYYLAYIIFNLLALALIIKAFLVYTLGLTALTDFLPTVPKHIFYITIIGAILVLKPISLLSLTLLGVALYFYFNTFSLCLRHLSSLFSISN